MHDFNACACFDVKPTKTAQELTTMAQEPLVSMREVVEDKGQPVLGLAQRHERDEFGCNWNTTVIKNARGDESLVHKIVSELR